MPVYDEDGKERTPRPERLGLKEMLRYFLDFRLATVRRRFEFELEQLRRRIHILEGFRIIFNALDKAIKLIRESYGKADASDKLHKAFKLDEEQADGDSGCPAVQDRSDGDQENPRRAEGEEGGSGEDRGDFGVPKRSCGAWSRTS